MKRPDRNDLMAMIREIIGLPKSVCFDHNNDYFTRTELLEILTFIQLKFGEKVEGIHANEDSK